MAPALLQRVESGSEGRTLTAQENPGPGAYAVPNGFGVSDRSPGRRADMF